VHYEKDLHQGIASAMPQRRETKAALQVAEKCRWARDLGRARVSLVPQTAENKSAL
jgi:hypothetical protein